MKILFIGNSYTYYNDLPSLFEKLCFANNRPVEVFSVTSGGRYLRHNLDTEDVTTLKLRDLLSHNRFDICILQEQSTYPIREKNTFLRDIQLLADYLQPHTDHFLLYATWGRQLGSKVLGELGMTSEGMSKALHDAYWEAQKNIALSTGLPVDVSPVGLVFSSANQLTGPDLYNPDLSHPSYEGSCLAAMVHYKTIFGQMPENLSSLNLIEHTEESFRNLVSTI